MKGMKFLVGAVAAALCLSVAGCSSNGSVHGSMSYTVGYGGYYSPYPYWGHGGGDVIIVNPDHPDRPDRPERPNRPERPVAKPPLAKPPGGIGRPRPRMRRR